MKGSLLFIKSTITILSLCLGIFAADCIAEETVKKQSPAWTEDFNLQECSFSTTGRNQYFILQPGYQLVLEGVEGKDRVKVVISVLKETQKIGDIETRIVEEKETVNTKIVEISRNYYAFCMQTNSVFYFGEEVDLYKDGKIIGHSGSWRAYSGDAEPGLMMPGTITLGAKYYQEIAPSVAVDRAEIISNNETLQTPAGKFENCLKTEETTPLEPNSNEYKFYAPGIGLIKDGELLLTKYGIVKNEN